jgi:hypothetical protein
MKKERLTFRHVGLPPSSRGAPRSLAFVARFSNHEVLGEQLCFSSLAVSLQTSNYFLFLGTPKLNGTMSLSRGEV